MYSPNSRSSQGLADLVLLADDEGAFRDALRFVLEVEGFETLAVSDGIEALDAIRTYRPKIAVLDLLMPGKAGHEVCAELGGEPELAGMATVLMSALAIEDARLRLREAGADFYLEKPFDHGELLHVVGRVMANRPVERPAMIEVITGVGAVGS